MTRSKAFRVALLRTACVPAGLVLSAALGSTALAQAAPPDAAGAALDEVVVTAKANFLSVDTSGATGLPVQIEKVPQSISLVSADFVRVANLKTVGDVADYTPGAVYGGVDEGVAARVKLRGFSAGQSLDGLQVSEFYDADYAVIDRLEVVKGPASVIYGISSPGGLVNRVTKSATASTPNYLSAQIGSWNSVRLEGQVAEKLDEDGRFRVIGVGVVDQGDSFQHVINHKTYVLYAGLNAEWRPDLTSYVHMGYEHHVRTSFDGIPTEADGSPAPVPRSFFIGAREDELTTDAFYANADLSWHATDVLDFNLKGQYERAKTTGAAPYAFGLDAAGNIGLAVETYAPRIEKDYGAGLSAVYKLDHFGIKDSFVSLAALYQAQDTDNDETLTLFNGDSTGSSNIFLGEAAISQAFRDATPTSTHDVHLTTIKTWTLTSQSILQPIDHLSLLFGASYSKPDILNSRDGVSQNLSPKGQVSIRAGATYEFLPGANVYGSFSQSFQPQQYIDINGAVLPPLTGDQYEAGLKWRLLHNRLLLTAAYFDIKQNNQAVFDTQIDGFDRYRAVGQVEHKGVELQALGRITANWQVNAGYAYLDPKITKDADASIVGKTDIFLPRHTASLFTSYSFLNGALNGLTLGAGVRYVGAQKTSFDGSTGDLPGYTVADGVIAYDWGPWSTQINVKNIFDKTYYINNYDTLFYGNTVGTPRSVEFTLRRRF